MKTFFCKKCNRPVIEAELKENVGAVIDGDVYCFACIPDENNTNNNENASEKAGPDPAPGEGPEKQEEKRSENKQPAPVSSSRSSRRSAAKSSSGSSRTRRKARKEGEQDKEVNIADLPWAEQPTPYKIKVIMIVLSGVFIAVGFIGLIARGCRSNSGAKKIVHGSKLSETLYNARTLKNEGISLFHKSKFKEALEKFYAAGDLYTDVLDKVKEKELTPEEIKQGISYDYIDNEYSMMLMQFLQPCREMKVRQESQDSGRY